jgi:hypothetical protein
MKTQGDVLFPEFVKRTVPATKWDAWKEAHFPEWWLKRHPIRVIPRESGILDYLIQLSEEKPR